MMIDDTDGTSRGGRLRLWELRGGLHCSLVGTCLSVADLRGIAARIGQPLDAAAPDHDVHARFVQAAGIDGPAARAMQRLLDRRHTGALRKIGRARDATSLMSLWREMRDGGMVPGAYWALLTSTHVPETIRAEVFGDVHMLSHLNGRSVHETNERASRAEARLADCEERLRRAERRHEQQLAERDGRIAALGRDVARLKAAQPAAAAGPPDAARSATPAPERDRTEEAAERQNRVIAELRERLRAAEAALAAERERVGALEELLFDADADDGDAPADRQAARAAAAAGINVLYLGGLTGQMPRLKSIAESWGAALVHHDGGMEDRFQRIDELVVGADAVFCPVDCVSHAACRHAKRLCRKFCKRFVPLRTASGAALEGALAELAATRSAGVAGEGAR